MTADNHKTEGAESGMRCAATATERKKSVEFNENLSSFATATATTIVRYKRFALTAIETELCLAAERCATALASFFAARETNELGSVSLSKSVSVLCATESLS